VEWIFNFSIWQHCILVQTKYKLCGMTLVRQKKSRSLFPLPFTLSVEENTRFTLFVYSIDITSFNVVGESTP
jgi:hypothetical protein